MAVVYKTQGQNAQRLLAMNETLREREDVARMDGENLRVAREEIALLRRRVDQHAEQMAEKDRSFQVCLMDCLSGYILSPLPPTGTHGRVPDTQYRVYSNRGAKGKPQEGQCDPCSTLDRQAKHDGGDVKRTE
jgi:hypothetical protein